MEIDKKYMRRALSLARKGMPYVSPNPYVGAVIVGPDGTIIGEGYHRRCGGPHAEVNAINSVADKDLLKDSTMYVTLEPCSHTGRTGPCADLIIKCGIPRVVVGMRDPFSKVNGSGIAKLRAAGVEVVEGVMEHECLASNLIFFTAHTQHRPFVMLKWAQSADGFIDIGRYSTTPPAKISSVFTQMLAHRMRALFDAILVGSGTVLADNPRLDNRLWVGNSPKPIILDRRGRVSADCAIMERDPWIIRDEKPLREILTDIYNAGYTSLLVEGGARIIELFLRESLWDMARVEIGPVAFGEYGSVPAPRIFGYDPVSFYDVEGHTIKYFNRSPALSVKNL